MIQLVNDQKKKKVNELVMVDNEKKLNVET